MSRRAAAPGILLAGLALSASGYADRLHLASGGSIDTERWWIEGATIYYETPAGNVGIPRAIVNRIETTGPGRATPESPAPLAAPDTPRDRTGDLDRAHRALEARDFELAASVYRDVLLDDPRASAARVGYALAQMGLGADGSALPVVREGLVLDPDYAGLHEALGMLLDRDERVDEALRAYREAFALAPSDRLRDKILRAERELHAAQHYDFAVSPHFHLRYDGDVDVALANGVLEVLERQHASLTDRYRFTPMQPIVVQLLPREAFRAVTQTPEWVGGLYDGKIRVPLGGLSRIGPAAERLLAHELTHAIVHAKSRGAAPRWLHEGLAQLAEGRILGEAEAAAVRTLLEPRAPAEWPALPFRYELALALTESLAERQGFDALVELLDELARGRDLDDALEHVFGATHAELLVACGRELLARERP